MKKLIGFVLVALPVLAAATVPYTFVAGQGISAAQLNANFAYLDSRVGDIAGSGNSTAISKAGILKPVNSAPLAPVLVVANQGATPIAVRDIVSSTFGSTASFRWMLDCGAAAQMSFAADRAPRFIPPGCSLLASHVGGSGESSYAVTYQP